MISVRSVLLLCMALAVAGGTAIYVKGWLEAERLAFSAQKSEIDIVETPAAEVLVAARNMRAGSFLKEDNVSWQAWPEEGVHDNHLMRDAESDDEVIAQLDGAVLRVGLKAGEPITNARVVHPGERGFLAAVLEPGFRAVSVPIDATSGISGFIFPGDWVDLMLTMQMRDEREGARQQRFFAQTILERVRVLAVDQAVELEDGEPEVGKTATLEVTPKEAERIAVSLEMGRLYLSLNSLSSSEGDAAQQARLLGIAWDEPVTDPRDVRNRQRSYTLDSDVYHMLGDTRLFPRKSKTRNVTVVRGSDSDVQAF